MVRKSNKWRPFVKWKKTSRNEEMYKLRLEGYTLSKLSRKYKISRERVRQIVHELSVPPRKYEAKEYGPHINKRILLNLKIITAQLKDILEPIHE